MKTLKEQNGTEKPLFRHMRNQMQTSHRLLKGESIVNLGWNSRTYARRT